MYICCQLYILHLKREWKILKFRNLRSLCGPSISFTKVMMICIQVFSRLLDLAIFVYNLGHIKQEKWTSLKGNYTWYPNDNDNNNKVMKSVNGFTLGLSQLCCENGLLCFQKIKPIILKIMPTKSELTVLLEYFSIFWLLY